MSDETAKVIEELIELEKKAIPAPWRFGHSCCIVHDTINDGKPYEGYIAGVAYNNNRDFIIALRNAFPVLADLALRAVEAEKKVREYGYWIGNVQPNLEASESRVRELEAERDKWLAHADETQDRVRELEEALKFYANQNTWKDGKPTEVDGLDFFPVAAVKNDGGFIARAALERKNA